MISCKRITQQNSLVLEGNKHQKKNDYTKPRLQNSHVVAYFSIEVNREEENLSDESYLLTYLLSSLVRAKCTLILRECTT